jgi:hypothetical protein
MRLPLVLKFVGLMALVSVLLTIGACFRLHNQPTNVGTSATIEAANFFEMNNAYKTATEGNTSGTGTIRFLSFEGGFYGIVSDDGKHYDPSNLSPEFQVNGLRVKFVVSILHVATYHMWGVPVWILHIEKLDETATEINPDSSNCSGDLDKLTTPYSNAIDGDWNTKIAWNTSLLGDFSVIIIENYSVSTPPTDMILEFKAYHHKEISALTPTPMDIQFWNGSSWKKMYELDGEQHVNETFTEKINVPSEAFADGKITIKTTVRYSSHVAGGILPTPPVRLLQYVEYYEGKLSTGDNNVFPIGPLLLLVPVITAAVIIGSFVFLATRKKKHRLPRGPDYKP